MVTIAQQSARYLIIIAYLQQKIIFPELHFLLAVHYSNIKRKDGRKEGRKCYLVFCFGLLHVLGEHELIPEKNQVI